MFVKFEFILIAKSDAQKSFLCTCDSVVFRWQKCSKYLFRERDSFADNMYSLHDCYKLTLLPPEYHFERNWVKESFVTKFFSKWYILKCNKTQKCRACWAQLYLRLKFTNYKLAIYVSIKNNIFDIIYNKIWKYRIHRSLKEIFSDQVFV